jgi:hypothetical protein
MIRGCANEACLNDGACVWRTVEVNGCTEAFCSDGCDPRTKDGRLEQHFAALRDADLADARAFLVVPGEGHFPIPERVVANMRIIRKHHGYVDLGAALRGTVDGASDRIQRSAVVADKPAMLDVSPKARATRRTRLTNHVKGRKATSR